MGLAFVSHKLGKLKESLSLLRHICSMGYNTDIAVLFGWRVCDVIIELKELYTNNGDINVSSIYSYNIYSRVNIGAIHRIMSAKILFNNIWSTVEFA